MPEMSEQELVAACQRGERTAQHQLFQRYKDQVYRMALHMVHDTQSAEDMTQKVFIKVFENLPKFRGDAAVSSWIYRITTNICIN